MFIVNSTTIHIIKLKLCAKRVLQSGSDYQGCAGRPFIPRGGAGKGKNPRGGAKVKIRGAGRGKKARKSTNSKILQKCEKYNITYYNINYNIIIIL